MSSPKPCLGYPSRTAAILAMRSQGNTTADIAARIGIPSHTVTALEASAARAKGRGASRDDSVRAVVLPVDLFAQLGPHAAKRGVSSGQLARLILKTVISEKMVDAVLDDDAEWGDA